MKKVLSPALKVAVTLGLFWWVFSSHGLDRIGALLAQARWSQLLLALAVFTASNFLGALQWQRLLHGQGVALPLGRANRLYFIGIFFNVVLPGSLGGDVVKIYSISRVERKGREGLAATFVDRFAGFFMLALFAVGSSIYLLFSPLLAGQLLQRDLLVYVAMIFLMFLAGTIVLFSRRVSRLIYDILLARVDPLGLKSRFREMHECFHQYRHQYGLGLQVFLLSLAIQFMRVAVHYHCALAIGFRIDFVYFLLFVPLIAMVAMAPVSFGGLGVREGIAPFLFTSVAAIAAVDPAGSLAMTTQLLASLVGIATGLAGGVLFMLSRSARPTEALPSPSEMEPSAPAAGTGRSGSGAGLDSSGHCG